MLYSMFHTYSTKECIYLPVVVVVALFNLKYNDFYQKPCSDLQGFLIMEGLHYNQQFSIILCHLLT